MVNDPFATKSPFVSGAGLKLPEPVAPVVTKLTESNEDLMKGTVQAYNKTEPAKNTFKATESQKNWLNNLLKNNGLRGKDVEALTNQIIKLFESNV